MLEKYHAPINPTVNTLPDILAAPILAKWSKALQVSHRETHRHTETERQRLGDERERKGKKKKSSKEKQTLLTSTTTTKPWWWSDFLLHHSHLLSHSFKLPLLFFLLLEESNHPSLSLSLSLSLCSSSLPRTLLPFQISSSDSIPSETHKKRKRKKHKQNKGIRDTKQTNAHKREETTSNNAGRGFVWVLLVMELGISLFFFFLLCQ